MFGDPVNGHVSDVSSVIGFFPATFDVGWAEGTFIWIEPSEPPEPWEISNHGGLGF